MVKFTPPKILHHPIEEPPPLNPIWKSLLTAILTKVRCLLEDAYIDICYPTLAYCISMQGICIGM